MDLRIKYLDLRAATIICSNYQHLIGLPFHFSEAGDGKVQHVIVAPYSKILQWQYTRQFLSNREMPGSLDIINLSKFDVIVISDQFVKYRHALYIKTLRSYVKEHNIPFDIKAY